MWEQFLTTYSRSVSRDDLISQRRLIGFDFKYNGILDSVAIQVGSKLQNCKFFEKIYEEICNNLELKVEGKDVPGFDY